MSRIWRFIKRELTLCIAFAAALVSCLFVPPDGAYFSYLDLRTLALLYCLMVVVSGLGGAGLFRALAQWLCRRAHDLRAMGLVLTALCFFSSMLITNDVAMLTFVPLAFTVPGLRREPRALIWIVVLQTVAANLGSMLTPVGNPQNLYLYSRYAMSASAFFSATGPVWALSALLLTALCFVLPRRKLDVPEEPAEALKLTPLIVYGALCAICLLVVFRVVPWPYMLAIVIAVLLVYDRRMLLSADFFLLLTFVCFFVFSGNLARIPAVKELLITLLTGRELLVSAAASQVISNVPAAILLSGFTENARALLLGVDIGGLGTPVASLASLIGFKLYARSEGADMKRFLLLFLAVNAALLAILLTVCPYLTGLS